MSDVSATTIRDALRPVLASYDKDELAYLAVTSKSEASIRDRLAWRLQQDLSPRVVAREWKHADLALLEEDGTPSGIIELYTMGMTDPLSASELRKAMDKVKNDLKKSRVLAPEASHYALVVATTIGGAPPPNLGKDVIKYLDHWKREWRNHGHDAAGLRSEGRQVLGEHLSQIGELRDFETVAGVAFNTLTVWVDCWLVGPARISRSQLLAG